MLAWIADCRGTTHELGGSIEPFTETRESAKHESDVTAEDTAILVDFVDDHEVE
jgi:hypothetical protein